MNDARQRADQCDLENIWKCLSTRQCGRTADLEGQVVNDDKSDDNADDSGVSHVPYFVPAEARNALFVDRSRWPVPGASSTLDLSPGFDRFS